MALTQEHDDVIRHLALLAARVIESIDPRLVPVTGAGIGYAVTGARDDTGVAAVKGGIKTTGKSVSLGGPCAFGTNDRVSPVILTAMKFDPAIRSAAVLHFSPAMTDILEDMLLECCSFDPLREPPGITTMDWGVASCCRDGVPDVIYNRSTPKKEPLLRFFGENPEAVGNNIIMLSNRIIPIEL